MGIVFRSSTPAGNACSYVNSLRILNADYLRLKTDSLDVRATVKEIVHSLAISILIDLDNHSYRLQDYVRTCGPKNIEAYDMGNCLNFLCCLDELGAFGIDKLQEHCCRLVELAKAIALYAKKNGDELDILLADRILAAITQ